MIKKFDKYINESVRDLMKPKSDEKFDIAVTNSIEELKHLITNYFNITEKEVNVFLSNHFKTLIWSFQEEGKSAKDIFNEWEYLLYNTFGEDKIKYNESIRDLMKPKSEEEILKSLSHLKIKEIFKLGIKRVLPWLVEYALKQGVNPDFIKDKKTLSLIIDRQHHQITDEYIDIVKLLIKYGINIHYRGDILLIWASRNQYIDIVNLLLDTDIDIDSTDKEQYTALAWACQVNDYEIAKLLIDKGANINIFPDILRNAADYGYMKIAKLLLDSGFDIYKNNEALEIAATRNNIKMIELLISYGANIRDNHDMVLQISAVNGYNDILKLCIEKECNVQVSNNNAIQRAAYYGRMKTMKILIDNGADIHKSSELALNNAVHRNHIDAAKLLLDNGADITKLRKSILEEMKRCEHKYDNMFDFINKYIDKK